MGFNALSTWQFHIKNWIKCSDNISSYPRYEFLENETFTTFKKVFEFIKSFSKIILKLAKTI